MSARPSAHNVSVVAALIRHGEHILLVEQQGPDFPIPTWALPGGVVESGESLKDALTREVREETGLIIHDLGTLLYLVQSIEGDASLVAAVFEVREWSGTIQHDDPDGFVLDARFLPLAAALSRLDALPWRSMREPLTAYLRGQSKVGAVWIYRAIGGETNLTYRSL